MKRLQIRIAPDGEQVDVDVEGFSGDACIEATRKLERGIGAVEERKRKPAFYRRPAEKARRTVGS